MSNDAFHHQNPKVSDGMVILMGIMTKRKSRSGHRRLMDFAPKLRQDMYTPCRKRLGCTPEAQLKVIETALEVAHDRHLVDFDPTTRKLFLTSKGRRARETYLQQKNATKVGRSKTRLGQPLYAHS